MDDLDRSVAGLLCLGFDGLEVPQATKELLRRGAGAVVLFARNVESPRQVAALCAELKRLAGRPLLIAVDQEGGRVRRLRQGFMSIPSMRTVGRAGDAALAERLGAAMARELRAVHIDMNFAPVLDVDSNPANPVIADRSFGADAEFVARLGCALIRGLQGGASGVAACGKHFPGHGDTSQDSHHHLPRLPHELERLEQVELVPFAAAAEAGVAALMTSHVVFEPLDPKYPATMSRAALDGILRDKLRFDGAVISDDLEMQAIAAQFPIEQVMLRGINAGVDLFAICHKAELQFQAIDALRQAVERGQVPRGRIAEAARRVSSLLARYARPAGQADLTCLNCAEHQKMVAEINRRAGVVAEEAPDPTDFRE